MTNVFCTIFNMSVSASVLVLVVLLLRPLTKQAPKWINVLLWVLVAVRLIFPFVPESPVSLMPKTDWLHYEATDVRIPSSENLIPDRIDTDAIHESESGNNVTVVQNSTASPEPQIEVHRGINMAFLLSRVWAIGTVVMLAYMSISYIHVYRRIRGAEHLTDNIYRCGSVSSPFVFGLLKPRICLPKGLEGDAMTYVIAHEKAHIRWLDHWLKTIGFLMLAVHWFNPLVWLSYVLLCRDIELACDERVVRNMGAAARADYSEALLVCSGNRRGITPCPLAFGEVSVKERIKTVLSYKKPAFLIVILAVAACAAAAVFFLTDPARSADRRVTSYLNDSERTLIYEGENDGGEEKKLYVKLAASSGPEEIGYVLTIKPNVYLTVTEAMAIGKTQYFSIPGNCSYFLEAYRISGKNGNATFDIMELMQEDYDEGDLHSRDIIPPYVIDTSYELASDAAPCTLDKNLHGFENNEKGYSELLFLASDRELYVGVKWEHTGPNAEWTLLPENTVTVYHSVGDVTEEEIKTLLDRYIILDYEVLDSLLHSQEKITVEGRPYYRVTDSRFDTWAEFEAFFASIYHGEELGNQLDAISKFYINVDGNTWVTAFGRGNLLSMDYRYEFTKTGDNTGELCLIRTGLDNHEDRIVFDVVMIAPGELRIVG